MSRSKSDDAGRAFEFAIAIEIEERIKKEDVKFEIDKKSEEDNIRGKKLFLEQKPEVQKDMKIAAEKLVDWLVETKKLTVDARQIALKRFGDLEGTKSNPIDIQLTKDFKD
ncbi:MAG: hypothetical protein ABH828_02115 [archaeon]